MHFYDYLGTWTLLHVPNVLMWCSFWEIWKLCGFLSSLWLQSIWGNIRFQILLAETLNWPNVFAKFPLEIVQSGCTLPWHGTLGPHNSGSWSALETSHDDIYVAAYIRITYKIYCGLLGMMTYTLPPTSRQCSWNLNTLWVGITSWCTAKWLNLSPLEIPPTLVIVITLLHICPGPSSSLFGGSYAPPPAWWAFMLNI